MNPKLISMCGECGDIPALRTIAIDCLTGEPLAAPTGGGGATVGDSCLNPTFTEVCVLPDVTIAAMPNVTIGSMPAVAVATMPNVTIGSMPSVAIASLPAVTVATEIYRLDGAASATSTPSTAPASVPVVGNTVTITAPYKQLSWRWLRASVQDAGAGATAKVDINGFSYFPGYGPVYLSEGWSIKADSGETFSGNHTFLATGSAYIEIIVIR